MKASNSKIETEAESGLASKSSKQIVDELLTKKFPYASITLEVLASDQKLAEADIEPFIPHLGRFLTLLRNHNLGKTVQGILNSIKRTYPTSQCFQKIQLIIQSLIDRNSNNGSIAKAYRDSLLTIISWCLKEQSQLTATDLLWLADYVVSYVPESGESGLTLTAFTHHPSLDVIVVEYLLRNVNEEALNHLVDDLGSANLNILVYFLSAKKEELVQSFRRTTYARLHEHKLGCVLFTLLASSQISIADKQYACSKIEIPAAFWETFGVYYNQIPQEILLYVVSTYYDDRKVMNDLVTSLKFCPPYILCLLAAHPDRGIAEEARLQLDDL